MIADPIGKFALTNRRALVTGASSGLGARIAATLSAAGAELVLTGRIQQRLQEVAAGLSGPATIVPGDLHHPGFRVSLIDQIRARHEDLHILVNCAGTCDNGPLGLRCPRKVSRHKVRECCSEAPPPHATAGATPLKRRPASRRLRLVNVPMARDRRMKALPPRAEEVRGRPAEAARYSCLVPKILSPASPSPGMM